MNVHELRDAESVLGGWIDDYNRQAPHSALGMRPPAEYRASMGRGWLLCLDSLSRLGNGQYQERC